MKKLHQSSIAVLGFLFFATSLQAQDVELKFPKNHIQDIVAIYQKLSEKTVIADVSDTEGVMISLVTATKVTKAEAIQLIEVSIEHAGFKMEEAVNGKAVKLIPNRKAPFRHAVYFKFKDGTPWEEVKEIEKAFVALEDKIEAIKDLEWGPSESVEGLNDGFTHCFFVTFKDRAGLETYLPHPEHKAFVELLEPKLGKVFVFDYTAR